MKKITLTALILILLVSCAKKTPEGPAQLPKHVTTYTGIQTEHEETVVTSYGSVSVSVYDEPLRLINQEVALTIYNALNAKIANVVTDPEKYGIYFDKTAVTAPVVVTMYGCSLMNNIASYNFGICVYTIEEEHPDFNVFIPQTWSIGVNYDLNTGNELTIADIFTEGADYNASISQHIAALNTAQGQSFQGLNSVRGFYLSPLGLDILEKGVDPIPFNTLENITLGKYNSEILWADAAEVEYLLLETPMNTEHQVRDYRAGLNVEVITLIDEPAGERIDSFIPKEYPEGDYTFHMDVHKYSDYIAFSSTEYKEGESTTSLHLLDAATGSDVLLSSLFTEGFNYMSVIQNEALLYLGIEIPADENIQFTLSAQNLCITIPRIPNCGMFTIPFSKFGVSNMALFNTAQ